ncbi:hypothetical protein AB7M22_002494 [Pseudomonas sp. ADAK2 TE3594]
MQALISLLRKNQSLLRNPLPLPAASLALSNLFLSMLARHHQERLQRDVSAN